MIPAKYPYTACFASADGREAHSQPVIAWDSEGFALIADHDRGRLCRASDDPQFCGLIQSRNAA